jgi:AbrB family looped-hinge helix DNA binding protein
MQRISSRLVTFSKVSVRSQTVIPREVREQLKLKPGDTLRYRVTEDGVSLCRPSRRETPSRTGHFQSQAPTFVAITDHVRAGLPAPSVVRTAQIACIEPARIERRAGRLDKATAKAVAQKLKGFLGSA